MSNLYDSLRMVQTAIVNSIGETLITGSPRVTNYVGLLQEVAEEVNSNIDFMGGLEYLSSEDLEELGFGFLHDESDLMLFPLWLYTFIPDGTELRDVNGAVIIKGEEDNVSIWAEHWINMGIIID